MNKEERRQRWRQQQRILRRSQAEPKSQRIPIDGGTPCPKCHRPMQRYQHPDGWEPKHQQPYYFVFWDRCSLCGHMQHYEAAKRFLSTATTEAGIDRALDRQQLHMLAETGHAELPYQRPDPDPIVISRAVYVRR